MEVDADVDFAARFGFRGVGVLGTAIISVLNFGGLGLMPNLLFFPHIAAERRKEEQMQ